MFSISASETIQSDTNQWIIYCIYIFSSVVKLRLAFERLDCKQKWIYRGRKVTFYCKIQEEPLWLKFCLFRTTPLNLNSLNFVLSFFVSICSCFLLGCWWGQFLPTCFISIKETNKLLNILLCGNKRFPVILCFYIITETSIRNFCLTYTDTNAPDFLKLYPLRVRTNWGEKSSLFAFFVSHETVSLLLLP